MQQAAFKPEQNKMLKQLYQRRFLEEPQPKGLVERVLTFQKKIQSFKNSRIYRKIIGIQSAPPLLEEGFGYFRPSTQQNSPYQHHPSKDKQLKIAMGKQDKQKGLQFLKNNTRERNFFSLQQYRKKIKQLSDVKEWGRLTPLGSSISCEKQYTNRSELKSKITTRTHQKSYSFTPQQETKQPVLSRRVFIGGHDLEKAAQQYNKQCKEIDRNLQMYQLQKKKQLIVRNNRTSLEKYRKKKLSKKKRVVVSVMNHRSKKKNEQTLKEDEDLNIELNPWKIDGQFNI